MVEGEHSAWHPFSLATMTMLSKEKQLLPSWYWLLDLTEHNKFICNWRSVQSLALVHHGYLECASWQQQYPIGAKGHQYDLCQKQGLDHCNSEIHCNHCGSQSYTYADVQLSEAEMISQQTLAVCYHQASTRIA